MRSFRSRKFKKQCDELPAQTLEDARKAYKLWAGNQSHPGLNFEKVDDKRNLWSVRLTLDYRAICRKSIEDGETIYLWIWIGDHDTYLRIIND